MKKLWVFYIACCCSLGCATDTAQQTTSINCNFSEKKNRQALTATFKSYWFDGTAEINTYALEQPRYGTLRQGKAVLIYVTEDFLPAPQVKANVKSEASRTVLKNNRTKTFLTGIYPYTIMSSSFSYLGWEPRLAKVSTSIQEWCGQSYLQLNRKKEIELISHSYFEGEADQMIHFPSHLKTEDELWNLIRIHPQELPSGSFELLPSLEWLRLHHKPLEAVPVTANLEFDTQLPMASYQVRFPSLGRTLLIQFQSQPPYRVESWEDQSDRGESYTTIARRLQTEKLPYWQLNKKGDEQYRISLELNTTL